MFSKNLLYGKSQEEVPVIQKNGYAGSVEILFRPVILRFYHNELPGLE